MDPDILAHRGDPLLNEYGSAEERAGNAAVGQGQMWANMKDNIDLEYEMSLIQPWTKRGPKGGVNF